MTETELTTNDMVNLLRFLGNETEWTYQPNHDESIAIQSFVQAKNIPQRTLSTTNDTKLFSSSFMSMMEQQRNSISCVSPSLEEMDEGAVRLEQEDMEYRANNKVFLPLDVAELMTSELIDYDRFAKSVPEEPKSIGNDEEKIGSENRYNIQNNGSLLFPKGTERNENSRDDGMESPKTKRAKTNIKSPRKKAHNKTQDGNASGPLRALSAYNFFFRDERDRILNNKDHDWSQEKEDSLLQGHWNRDRSEKRVHCKTHGKLSFTALSKEVSRRWKALPSQQREFYHRVARRDWNRYGKELAAAETSQD